MSVFICLLSPWGGELALTLGVPAKGTCILRPIKFRYFAFKISVTYCRGLFLQCSTHLHALRCLFPVQNTETTSKECKYHNNNSASRLSGGNDKKDRRQASKSFTGPAFLQRTTRLLCTAVQWVTRSLARRLLTNLRHRQR